MATDTNMGSNMTEEEVDSKLAQLQLCPVKLAELAQDGDEELQPGRFGGRWQCYAWALHGACGSERHFLTSTTKNYDAPILEIYTDGTGELQLADDDEDINSLGWLRDAVPSTEISSVKEKEKCTYLMLKLPDNFSSLGDGEESWTISKATKCIEERRVYVRKGDLVLSIVAWEHRAIYYDLFFANDKDGEEDHQYVAKLASDSEKLMAIAELVNAEDGKGSTIKKRKVADQTA